MSQKKNAKSAEASTNTIRLHRVLAAKPEKVYRAFLDADAMAKWLPPFGFTCRVHHLDAKVGGTFRMSFTNFTTGKGHSFGGEYLELVPHERICYTDQFFDPNLPGLIEVAVALKAVSVGTEIEIEQTGSPSAIPLEACYLGWQQSLRQLAEFVEPEIAGEEQRAQPAHATDHQQASGAIPAKITVETTVAAPIDQVWRAYTTPDDIKQWNAASADWHTTAASVDLREGGSFSSRMEAKDGSMGFNFAGTYTKIVDRKLIAYSFGGRKAQITFTPGPNGAAVRVTFDSEPTHSIEQQRAGWQRSSTTSRGTLSRSGRNREPFAIRLSGTACGATTRRVGTAAILHALVIERQPRRAALIPATSIFFMPIIATGRERLGQQARRDLPGDAPLVLAPAARALLAAIADYGVPIAVMLSSGIQQETRSCCGARSGRALVHQPLKLH
jgi:uncharacterized protein YndB with AHSA1/START domain